MRFFFSTFVFAMMVSDFIGGRGAIVFEREHLFVWKTTLRGDNKGTWVLGLLLVENAYGESVEGTPRVKILNIFGGGEDSVWREKPLVAKGNQIFRVSTPPWDAWLKLLDQDEKTESWWGTTLGEVTHREGHFSCRVGCRSFYFDGLPYFWWGSQSLFPVLHLQSNHIRKHTWWAANVQLCLFQCLWLKGHGHSACLWRRDGRRHSRPSKKRKEQTGLVIDKGFFPLHWGQVTAYTA